MSREQAGPPTRARVAALFAGWACAGLLGAFGVAALLTIGILVLLAAGALAAILLWLGRGERTPLLGLGLGAASIVGYLGWLNRDGPGTACHPDAQLGVSCTDEWTPWPFFVLAAVLTIASVAMSVHVAPARRARARSVPPSPTSA